jgi:hypothetical protein
LTGQRLGELLVDQGLISWMDVASALQVQWRRNVPPISVTEVAEARSYKDTDATLRSQLASTRRGSPSCRRPWMSSRLRSPTATDGSP